MKKKPLIGITTGLDREQNLYTNHRAYAAAILSAGGIPLLLPADSNAALAKDFLDTLDGILFSGGPDISPSYFNEECLDGFPMPYSIIPERDAFEISLYRTALMMDMPVFAICRGIQLMAAANGGSILQDIDALSERPLRIRHMQKAPDWYASHTVHVAENSLLFSACGLKSMNVNSFHHQAVLRFPAGYRISARANDGIIEAAESAKHSFVLGVQWHPERTITTDNASLTIFRSFIQAAISFRTAL